MFSNSLPVSADAPGARFWLKYCFFPWSHNVDLTAHHDFDSAFRANTYAGELVECIIRQLVYSHLPVLRRFLFHMGATTRVL